VEVVVGQIGVEAGTVVVAAVAAVVGIVSVR